MSCKKNEGIVSISVMFIVSARVNKWTAQTCFNKASILDTELIADNIWGLGQGAGGLGYSLSGFGLFGEFSYIIVGHFYLF